MAGARGIRAGRAFVELGVDDKTQAALLRTERRLKAMAATVGAIGAKILAAGTAATAGFGLAARVFAKTGDALDKMSGRTGIGAQALSELGFAAEQSGSSLETLEKGSRNLSRSVLDAQRGLKTATDSFDDLGLSFGALSKLTPEDQLLAVGSALANVEDPAKRAALAMKIFGRAGTELLPLFNSGPAGIEALRKQARDFGLTLGQDTAKQAAVLNDAMSLARRSIRAVVVQIGGALAPGLTRVSGYIANAAAHTNRWVSENKGLIVTVAQGAAVTLAAGAALIGLAGALFVGAKAFGVFAAAWAAGKSVILAGTAAMATAKVAALALVNPITLLGVGLVGAAAAFVVYSGAADRALSLVGERFGVILDIARETFSGIVTAIRAGDLEAATEVATAGMYAIWVGFSTGVAGLWIDFKEGFFSVIDDIVDGAASLVPRLEGELNKAGFAAAAFLERRKAASLPEDQRAAALGAIDAAQQGFNRGIDASTAKRLGEIAADSVARKIDRLGDFQAERSALEAVGGAALQAANDRLNDAIDKANRAYLDAKERIDGAVPEDLAKRFEEIFTEFDGLDLGERIRRQTAGIFNIAALRSLVGGKDTEATRAAKETASASKESLRVLRRMEQNSRRGGIVLA